MPGGDSAWHYVETHRGSDHPRVPNLKTSATELFKRRYHKLLSFASNLSATNSPGVVFSLPGPVLASDTNECSYRYADFETLPPWHKFLLFQSFWVCKLFQAQCCWVHLTSANVYCCDNRENSPPVFQPPGSYHGPRPKPRRFGRQRPFCAAGSDHDSLRGNSIR